MDDDFDIEDLYEGDENNDLDIETDDGGISLSELVITISMLLLI